MKNMDKQVPNNGPPYSNVLHMCTTESLPLTASES